MTTPSSHADRNLLFGLLALQMDFVSRDQLLEAMNAWMLEKHVALGDIFCRRGILDAEQHAALAMLLTQHLRRHGGDPQASLAAVPISPQLRRSLAALDDADVRGSL